MTSFSNTTSKHCLIKPGVCVWGGGGATYFAFKTFFIHVIVNTYHNEQMFGRTEFSLGAYPSYHFFFQISPHCYIDLNQFLSQNQTNFSHINEH